MSDFLRDGLRGGRWNRLDSATAFADTVTAQLRSIAHDQHLHLYLDARDLRLVEHVTPEERKRPYDDAMQETADEYPGVPEVRIMAGNVPLLRMDDLVMPRFGAQTFAAAMAFVHSSRALVIDRRHNSGGHSDQYVWW